MVKVRRSKLDCANWTGDQPDKPFSRKGAFVFEAVAEGRRVGCIRVDDTRDGAVTSYVHVAGDQRRRGAATRLYEAAARASCLVFKKPLTTDEDLQTGARRFWEKQERAGRAACLERQGGACLRFQLRCPAPRNLSGKPR